MEEGIGGFGFSSTRPVARRRRSFTLRRPQSDLQVLRNYIPWRSSDNLEKKASLEKSGGILVNGGSSEQGCIGPDLNCCTGGVLALRAPEGRRGISSQEKVRTMKSGRRDGYMEKSSDDRIVGAPNVLAENKLSKVKAKYREVARAVRGQSELKSSKGSCFARATQSSDLSQQKVELMYQEKQGKDVSGSNLSCEAKENSPGKVSEVELATSPGPVRKSKRTPKRRILYSTSGDCDNDDEVHCLEKIRPFKLAPNYMQVSGNDIEASNKKLKVSNIPGSRKTAHIVDEDYGFSSRSNNVSQNKSAYRRVYNDTYNIEKEKEDTYNIEKEEKYGHSSQESKRNKKQKVPIDSSINSRVELPTTRQHALQSGKDGTSLNLIEFPNGLPLAPPRKQKEKLSVEEQQAKKAEAAQRRKIQLEIAAREAEARAIRKILGVDSDKRKAEKERKQAEKAKVASQSISSCTVRLVMGPSGTLVTFPEGVDLPSIFVPKPSSYPPPREICAGPSCTNAYKYRDSRSNLPLCSLQCYRAVQGASHPMTTC